MSSIPAKDWKSVWELLTSGIRDYVRKNGFTDVVLGLSGGMDSALVAALAVDALGKDHVHGVMMPSPWSSEGSITDSEALAANLGMETFTVPISPMMEAFEKALAQLQKMRGREVNFHTALCVWNGMDADPDKTAQKEIVKTVVTFRDLPDEELKAYLNIEEPYDCAGSAKNEALGIAILEKIESSDPTALTGLPLIALTTMLRQCGLSFFSGAAK